MTVKLKKILPIEVNFELKNFFEKFKKKDLEMDVSSGQKRIFFLDAASYNNLGDQAIAYAISEFIKQSFQECLYVEVSEKHFLRNLKYLKKNIKEGDIICLTGGGNMGNLYPRYEAIRRKVIKSFKNNQIIIFPQTIDYEQDAYGLREMKRSAKVYNKHFNLTVCAREQKSYERMSKLYNRVEFVPDIVLYLCGKMDFEENNEFSPVGICLRNDKESILTIEERENIKNQFSENGEITLLTTMSKQNLIDMENRRDVIYEKLKEFSKCKLIVTDRLHGMIFSMICGVPCIVIDNSNKKISGVLETVKEHIHNVYRLEKEDINNVTELLNKEKLVKQKNSLNIFDNFKNIFEI